MATSFQSRSRKLPKVCLLRLVCAMEKHEDALGDTPAWVQENDDDKWDCLRHTAVRVAFWPLSIVLGMWDALSHIVYEEPLDYRAAPPGTFRPSLENFSTSTGQLSSATVRRFAVNSLSLRLADGGYHLSSSMRVFKHHASMVSSVANAQLITPSYRKPLCRCLPLFRDLRSSITFCFCGRWHASPPQLCCTGFWALQATPG